MESMSTLFTSATDVSDAFQWPSSGRLRVQSQLSYCLRLYTVLAHATFSGNLNENLFEMTNIIRATYLQKKQ